MLDAPYKLYCASRLKLQASNITTSLMAFVAIRERETTYFSYFFYICQTQKSLTLRFSGKISINRIYYSSITIFIFIFLLLIMNKIMNLAKIHGKLIHKHFHYHIKTHKHHYGAGLFGSFALVKMIMLIA